MPLSIIRADISTVAADAIVNSANPNPVVGQGVDSALHEAAGGSLLRARRRVGHIEPGQVAVTRAGRLPARWVIHTVGPLWADGASGELETLACCYSNALAAAASAGCHSIAFPLISTGTYGFPKDLALRVAKTTIEGYLAEHDMDVTLVVYDSESFRLSAELADEVQSFIDAELADEVQSFILAELADEQPGLRRREAGQFGDRRSDSRRREVEQLDDEQPDSRQLDDEEAFFGSASLASTLAAPVAAAPTPSAPAAAAPTAPAPTAPVAATPAPTALRSLDDVLSQVDESFAESLLRMIDERGMTDPEVYRRANIDRKLFSKIRNNAAYQPKKGTALGLAVALRLNLDETLDLIGRAGYTLSNASIADLVVRYFIEREHWDVNDINLVLFEYNQPLIGR